MHEEIWRSLPPGAVAPDLERRARFALSLVRPGERVLDVGCGDGAIAARLAAAGALVTGADVAGEALRRAGGRGAAVELVRLEEGEPWPFADGAFDVVWASEVIEHVADTAAWLSELRRALAPGGRIGLTTPDTGPLTLAAMALSPGFAARRLDPVGDHLHFYNARSLRALLADFGFERVDVRRAGGVPGARTTLLASAVRRRF
ncbi:MAG TPA: class I SAM-dependent methyltransferase [Solirubrobacteraceae bacterium]|nr:class I SAM-dependent methyltransferase [Solirubrobacteraceae bacterium]